LHLDTESKRASYTGTTAIIILLFIAANVLFFALKSSNSLTGNAVAEGSRGEVNIDLILFIVQIIVVVIFIIFLYFRHLRKKKAQEIKLNISEFESFKNAKSGTDMDVLYSILQSKGELSLSVIVNVFKISKDKALKWCKILEEHNLASLNYPVFGEPILKKKQEAEK